MHSIIFSYIPPQLTQLNCQQYLGMPQKDITFKSEKCAVASFVANYVTGVLHPFDVIKTRFQSHDGKSAHLNIVPKYDGILNAFKEIYRGQGVQGLFKGLHMTLLSQAVASSFYFWIYEQRKQVYIDKDFELLDSVALASLQAGVLATVITQPFWVIKTRMLLNTDSKVNEFTNLASKTKEIYQHHGPSGFLKGLSVNLVLAVLGVGQMFVYQGSKQLYDSLNIPQSQYLQKNFFAGAISKIVSGAIMYPLTTIRTRVQQNQYVSSNVQQKYSGVWDVTLRTWKEQGMRGFYKGLASNIIKGVPQKGLYFYSYELIKEKVFGIGQSKAHQKRSAF